MKRTTSVIMCILLMTLLPVTGLGRDQDPDPVVYNDQSYPLFPEILTQAPLVPSPFTTEEGREIVTCFTLDGRYFLVDATVENGEPLDYSNDLWWGKGRQTDVDSLDFPTLAKTGMHSETELDQTETITGVPVTDITKDGRPRASSDAGFMAEDEDILSVLKGDNRLVGKLGLTHPQCARPLFHVFNVILTVGKDSERGNIGGILYNESKVHLEFGGAKGWQESIFNDEILGYWQIEMRRELDQKERSLLERRYQDLTGEELAELVDKLSQIHTGEMVAYYIMRYGFYEGHTSYRADPIAIACIFGLRSMQRIEGAFERRLDDVLLSHFTGEETTD